MTNTSKVNPQAPVAGKSKRLFAGAIGLPQIQRGKISFDRFDCSHRMLFMNWGITASNGETVVYNKYFIRPEGFMVIDEMLSAPGLYAKTVLHFGVTTENLIKLGQPVEAVLQQFATDFENYDPSIVNWSNGLDALPLLVAEYARLGPIPSWLKEMNASKHYGHCQN